MFNEFFRKESPILGILGLGGGVARARGASGAESIEISGGDLVD